LERPDTDSIHAHKAVGHRILVESPHCLKKNATLATRLWSRISIAHSFDDRSRLRTAVATDNCPIDSGEVDLANGPQ
jgi:hypothetical protein